MRRLTFFTVGLFVVMSLPNLLCAPFVALGQNGNASTIAPPPRPLPTPSKVDQGRIEGSTYINEQFGFSFSAPATWSVHDRAGLDAIGVAVRKVFDDEKDQKVHASVEGSIDRTTVLFSASKFPLGTSGGFNAILLCTAERIPTAIITTPREYFNLILKTLNRTEVVSVEVLEPFQIIRIGTTDFGLATIKVSLKVGPVIEKLLITIRGLYAIAFAYSYVDNDDAATFDEVIKTIKTK